MYMVTGDGYIFGYILRQDKKSPPIGGLVSFVDRLFFYECQISGGFSSTANIEFF
jgi:hypothetical protein